MNRFVKSLVIVMAFIAIGTLDNFVIAADQPAPSAPAAPAIQMNKVVGTQKIDYQTRVRLQENGKPDWKVKDVYTTDLTIGGTTRLQGTMEHLPVILSGTLGVTQQSGLLEHNMTWSVINPKNPAQTRIIGKMVGAVPIDGYGVYQYDKGTLRTAIDTAGQAKGFTSEFRGQIVGKPPVDDSTLARAKKQAKSVKQYVSGKTMLLPVTDWDNMTYNGTVLAAGPAQVYPEIRISGECLYDYERGAWYPNLTMSYTDPSAGTHITDKITGNIKWVEDPNREANGKGHYIFDIRVNEPEGSANEEAVFVGADDEAAFFATDPNLAALTGTVEYKDTFRGETVVASDITYDLTSTKLTKVQQMNLVKLILSAVIPFNAE